MTQKVARSKNDIIEGMMSGLKEDVDNQRRINNNVSPSVQMIARIKVFGERNSGNNFIRDLIQKNVRGVVACGADSGERAAGRTELCSGYYKGGTGWAHGTPKLNLFGDTTSTLFVFVVRDLEHWLRSMHRTPYHLRRSSSVRSFLEDNIVGGEARMDHDVCVYADETGKTIFELRYYKLRSYISAFGKVDNAMMVNLECLQKDGGRKFVHELNARFHIPVLPEFSGVEMHTKIGTKKRNRKSDIVLDCDIVNARKNTELERFVESLKGNYHVRSASECTHVSEKNYIYLHIHDSSYFQNSEVRIDLIEKNNPNPELYKNDRDYITLTDEELDKAKKEELNYCVKFDSNNYVKLIRDSCDDSCDDSDDEDIFVLDDLVYTYYL